MRCSITECINAMYTGKMTVLSEQQLIDCDHAKPFEDIGCGGGDFTGQSTHPQPIDCRPSQAASGRNGGDYECWSAAVECSSSLLGPLGVNP